MYVAYDESDGIIWGLARRLKRRVRMRSAGLPKATPAEWSKHAYPV